MDKYIVGVGGAAVDIHAESLGRVLLRDSNPSRIHTAAGGVTRNILENLSMQGVDTVLLSAVGDDPLGSFVLDYCRRVGIDVSRVLLSGQHSTASYLSFLDERGDMLIASSDFDVLSEIDLKYLRENINIIKNSAGVVTDGNLTVQQLDALALAAKQVPIFIDPVSASKAERLKDFLGFFYLVKPNVMELEVLSGMKCTTDADIEKACDTLLSKGCRIVVVSLGERGCFYKDISGRSMFRKLSKTADVKNATGAGDAFVSGLISGFCRGFSVEASLDCALAMGLLTVESEETINKDITFDLVKKIGEKYGI